MTRQGIAGDGDEGIVSPLVDLDGLGLDALRSSNDPDIIGMVRFFVEKCEQQAAYGGFKVGRQD